MLKWFMKRKLKAFGDAFDYDTGYMQELVDVDPAAGLAVSRLSAAASYRADAPAAAWFAAQAGGGDERGLRTLRPIGRAHGRTQRRFRVATCARSSRATLRA